jgi:hypothetical protein
MFNNRIKFKFKQIRVMGNLLKIKSKEFFIYIFIFYNEYVFFLDLFNHHIIKKEKIMGEIQRYNFFFLMKKRYNMLRQRMVHIFKNMTISNLQSHINGF